MFPKFPARNKEKDLPVLTLHTGLMQKKGRGAGNSHMRTINNTEWGGGGGSGVGISSPFLPLIGRTST